jgi:capsular exopolysaccharide synthesis family protein
MGRVTDALRRAGLNQAGEKDSQVQRDDDLRFFTGGQVVSTSWDLDVVESPTDQARDERGGAGQVTPAARRAGLPAARPLGASVSQRVVVSPVMDPAVREQYRKLAASLHQLQTQRACKVVMVTSTLPQEGKTLTAINLALTFSESFSRQVLLIDADLRHPMLHEAFNLSDPLGLEDALRHDWRATLKKVRPCLTVLPSTRASSDPMEALASGALGRMLESARAEFDWIVIDTPPVGLLPDAGLLASLADTVLLVVGAATAPYDMVQRAVAGIGRERVFGVVLNRAERASSHHHYYYYASSAYRDGR